VTDERRVEVAAEADAAHLMWRGEPQHKPTRWTCSGCGTVVTSPADRDASRTAHAALVADLRALVGGDELVSQRAVNPDEYTRRTGDRVPSYLAFYQGAADLAAVIRALLDRHAPTTGETP